MLYLLVARCKICKHVFQIQFKYNNLLRNIKKFKEDNYTILGLIISIGMYSS